MLSPASALVTGTSLNTIQPVAPNPLNKLSARSVNATLSAPLQVCPTPMLFANDSVVVFVLDPICLSASTVNLYSVVTAG